MGRRQYVKSKDLSVRRTLDFLNRTRDRKPMPRPAVFKDRTKYDRTQIKQTIREEMQ